MPCLNEYYRPDIKEVVDALKTYSLHEGFRGVSINIPAGTEIIFSYKNDDVISSSVSNDFDKALADLWQNSVLTGVCSCNYHTSITKIIRETSNVSTKACHCLHSVGTLDTLLFKSDLLGKQNGSMHLSNIMPVERFVDNFVDCLSEQKPKKVKLILEEMMPATEGDVGSVNAKRERRKWFTDPDRILRLKGDFKRFGECRVPITYGVPTRFLDNNEELRSRDNIDLLLCLLGLPFYRHPAGEGENYYLEVQYHIDSQFIFLPTAVESRGNWFWMPVRALINGYKYNFTRDIREILTRESATTPNELADQILLLARRKGLPEVIHKTFKIGSNSVDDILVWRSPVRKNWIEYAAGDR